MENIAVVLNQYMKESTSKLQVLFMNFVFNEIKAWQINRYITSYNILDVKLIENELKKYSSRHLDQIYDRYSSGISIILAEDLPNEYYILRNRNFDEKDFNFKTVNNKVLAVKLAFVHVVRDMNFYLHMYKRRYMR